MISNYLPKLIVRSAPGGEKHHGLINIDGEIYPCNLGRAGIKARKLEGDGATPSGKFRLLDGYWRADRIKRISSGLQIRAIEPEMGWCDDISSPKYNKLVHLPSKGSHEKLRRTDRLYDICLVMDHNHSKRIKNRGSAIFFHLTRPDLGPTEGCVAVDPELMKKLLPRLNNETIMEITA